MNKYFLTLLLGLCTIGLYGQGFEGFALYSEINDNTTYLIDAEGDIAHTWNSQYGCNYAVQLLPDGNLARGVVNPGNALNGAAVGGRLEVLAPNGDVVWDFVYSSNQYVSHHDICGMPNGNVLMIAWDVRTAQEMQAKGYDGNGGKYPTRIIEVQQNGTGGEIVWQWDMYDHLVQDIDSSLPNYGLIAENPHKIDVNVETTGGGGPGGGGPGGGGGDWAHTNGLDYHADRDQIVFSSRYFSEIYVIDHSTTTEEAAGSTGGNAGMGGDILYRWGNPGNYGMSGEQVIPAAVHDTRWIPEDGRPNGGGIMFFNNEGAPNGGSTSDIIRPPYDGFNFSYTSGQAYGPTELESRHFCIDDSNGQSASDRLPNGNTFVALSNGYMYEVDQNDDVVWQYPEGPAKAFRYTCDYKGIQELLNVDCACESEGTAEISDCGICVGGDTGIDPESFDCNCDENGEAVLDNCGICVGGDTGVAPEDVDCNCEVNGGAVLDDCGDCTGGSTGLEPCATGIDENNTSIKVYPNPSKGIFFLEGLDVLPQGTEVLVFDLSGKKIQHSIGVDQIDISTFPSGTYFLSIVQNEAEIFHQRISLIK